MDGEIVCEKLTICLAAFLFSDEVIVYEKRTFCPQVEKTAWTTRLPTRSWRFAWPLS